MTMNEEKVDTYSTRVVPQKPLEIDYKNSGFEDVINEEGVIPTTLNVPVMVQRLAKDIYKNATSGIRELYMNAVRGCTDGVEMFGYKDPHIKVTINEGERIIIIEDNGRGITKARFKQVLRELGTSDNHDGTTTGQFGMGFASYMTLASVCVLDTIGDNGDNYKMLCRDGISSKYGGKSDLDSHGVKLTLTCYENVDFEEICKKLYDTASHASVPTTVVIEEFEYTPPDFVEGLNEIKRVSFDDVDGVLGDDEEPIRIDHEDFTLIACDSINNKSDVYLLNVPIESDIEIPFSYWILNIKDERKFQPMPDRDRMREESDKALQKQVDDAIRAHFSNMNIVWYREYIVSERRLEYLWLIQHPDYAPQPMQARLRQLNNCSYLREISYTDKSPSTHSLFHWLKAAGAAGITYQGHKSKAHSLKVREFIHKDCKLIICKKSVNDKWQDSVDILESFGVPTVKQILKDNKVKFAKIKREDVDERTIVGHEHGKYYETQEYIYEDITENFIRTDSIPMSKMMSLVREYPTDMTFLRNEPSLKETDCQTFSKWIEKFKTVEVMTNKGLFAADALAREESIAYCSDLEPDLMSVVEGLDQLIITDKDKVLGVAIIRHLEYKPKEWIGNMIDTLWLNTLFKNKYGINMYDDDTKKFFCAHLSEIKPAYHELFARVIVNIEKNFADEVATNQREKYLTLIKEYGELDTEDEVAKLKFYHEKWQNLPNKTAGITVIFDELITKSQETIEKNKYLLTKFVREIVLPKAYHAVDVRKYQLEEHEYHYSNDTFKVSFTTELRSLEFKEDVKVYGMNVKLTNIQIKIYKKFILIGGDLEVSA